MARLTIAKLRGDLPSGRYGDGDGLFLIVAPGGSRSWMCRVQKDGRRRDIGLGSAKKVGLAQAREASAHVRAQMHAGIDPVAERRKSVGIPTFREAAAKVFAENSKGWKNAKHHAQWLNSLQTYAFPTIGDIAVSEIQGAEVRDVLIRIWIDKQETARRVRQRIASVIDWAIAQGYRELPLPMAAINKSLPKVKKAARHHQALAYGEVPKFVRTLRARESIGRLAFELMVLTATRSGEIRGASWSEFDFTRELWTIPATRMKSAREHVIPLSTAALAVLTRDKRFREGGPDVVFRGARVGKPMSDMTLTKICRDLEIAAVPHGFRSSFRDWVAEATDFNGEVAEMALAHTISSKVEAAYRRGNLLEKRRALMAAWSDFCDTPA